MTSTAGGRKAVHYVPMSPVVKQDPEAYWSVLRESEPVHHFTMSPDELERSTANPLAAEPVGEFWSVLRHRDLTHLLQNPRTFSSTQGPGPDRMVSLVEGGVLLWADDPIHLRQRRLAAKAFTPRSVEVLVPRIQRTIDRVIDEHAGRGSMEILAAVGLPLSIRTIAGIMGVPESRAEDFQRWGNAIVATMGGDADAVEAGLTGIMELFGYVQSLIDAVRAGEAASVGPSLDTGVLAGLVRAEYEGTHLTDEEIRWICLQLITAGYETTSTATANGVYLLCSHPEQRALFESDSSRAKAAVEEIVRYASPLEGLFRTANTDVEIGGCPIPKDAKIRAVYASANRDPDVFSDAGSFRIDRDPAELRAHLGFGLGPHACIGAALARVELRIALGTLFRRLPGLELDPERPAVRNDILIINGYREVHVRWDPAHVLPANQLTTAD
jgi:cytochrome P450